MLALGIGATTAIFSLVEGILLRPLPFRDPERLVVLGDHLANGRGTGVTPREIRIYGNATTAFESLGGYTGKGFELSGGATPEEVNGARFSAGVFPTLGVEPALGRVFTEQEEDARAPVAVISYALWLNRYHRDPHILGSSVVLDRKTYTIIGVMPRSFAFPLAAGPLQQAQVWVPLSLTADELSDQNAGFWGFQIVARMKPGVTVQQGAQDADRVAQQVMRSFPAGMSTIHIRGDVTPLREFAVAEVRPILRALFLAVSVVLLLACVNVAGLMLVRAIRKRREFAVRLALGARSGVILRESFCEGLLLSLAGGMLGLALAATLIRTALHLLPDSMPRVDSISMDGTVTLFALVLGVVTGALCSIAPAFAAIRTNPMESLRDGARTGTGGASYTWLRSGLVVAEIAIAMMLLTVSGAFLRSLQKMSAVDPGFRPDHVLTAGFQLPLDQYPTESAVDTFRRELVERLKNKPGIVDAGITGALPGSDLQPEGAYTIEGRPIERWKLEFARFSTIDGDYFQTMGIPLLDGRTFTKDDRADSPLVLIVNNAMAEHCWPGERAVGRRMHIGNPKKGLPWATVVGVVGDTKTGSRDEPDYDQWYLPAKQPAILHGTEYAGVLAAPERGFVTIRSAMDPKQMIQTLQSTAAEVDPLLALQHVEPMDDVISNVEAPRRFNTGLITAFASAALLLAITGIYAVVAFSVSLRTQEIAIRMALGAQRGEIARLVLIAGGKMALLGCGIGVVGSVMLSRLVGSFLFDVSATDPLIYCLSVGLMLVMALLASALPARRAASADPIEALRSV